MKKKMKTYTYITQSKILPGDLHTPVSIYLKARAVSSKCFNGKLRLSELRKQPFFYRIRSHCPNQRQQKYRYSRFPRPYGRKPVD